LKIHEKLGKWHFMLENKEIYTIIAVNYSMIFGNREREFDTSLIDPGRNTNYYIVIEAIDNKHI
jgi:hypothetical protein